MDITNMEDEACGMVVGQQQQQLANRTLTKPSEIPQAEKMLPLTQILDDKGLPIEDRWVQALSNGNILSVLVDVDGKDLLLQPKGMNGMLTQVPAHAHFVRDEETQEQILRIPAVAGG